MRAPRSDPAARRALATAPGATSHRRSGPTPQPLPCGWGRVLISASDEALGLLADLFATRVLGPHLPRHPGGDHLTLPLGAATPSRPRWPPGPRPLPASPSSTQGNGSAWEPVFRRPVPPIVRASTERGRGPSDAHQRDTALCVSARP